MKFKITAMALTGLSGQEYIVDPQVAGLSPTVIVLPVSQFLLAPTLPTKEDIEWEIKKKIVEKYQSLVQISVDAIELEENWIVP